MRLLAWVFVAGLAVAGNGCSVVLPRLVAPACDSEGDCERFNLQFPDRVTACNRYQCNEATHRCFFGPLDRDDDGHFPVVECAGDDCDDRRRDVFGGRDEDCDGIDNDCDDVIDDEVAVERGIGVAIASIGPVNGLEWTADDGGAAALLGAATGGSLADLSGSTGALVSVDVTALEEPTNVNDSTLGATGCPAAVSGRATTCHLAQVAVAAGSPMSWAAFVSTDGCMEGQLRVGLLDVASGDIEMMGPDVRSNTWRGIDLNLACTRTATATGATAPAIVTALGASGSDAERATLVWTRDVAGRACAAGGAEVAALGLWRATGPVEGMTVDWVIASGSGAPAVLGRTRGVAPAALAATGTGETLVAFPDEAGGVRLTVLDALSPTAPSDPSSTPALVVGETVVVGTGDADQVAIVVSPSPTATLRIGLAWATACGGGGLRFASMTWTRGTRSFGPATVVDLAAAGASQPTLAFVPRGFVRSTLERGGTPVGTDDGGWLVAWRDSTLSPPSLVHRRVLAVDGSVLDEAAMPFGVELSTDPRSPFLYSGPAGETEHVLRVGFHDAAGSSLVGGAMLCPPPPT